MDYFIDFSLYKRLSYLAGPMTMGPHQHPINKSGHCGVAERKLLIWIMGEPELEMHFTEPILDRWWLLMSCTGQPVVNIYNLKKRIVIGKRERGACLVDFVKASSI